MAGRLSTRDDIFTEVLVRNNRSTTDSFITDTMLKQWFFAAHTWATAYHKWSFTEGKVSTTFTTAAGGDNGDEWYFEGYKADSFRIVQVGGKRLEKLNFEDYLIFQEEEPSADDRVYSDFGRTLFINPKVDASGTLAAWGQYQPYVDVTNETGKTLFSDYDEEGNEAIVEKMSGYLKRREHLVQEAEIHDQRAMGKLEEVWKRTLDEQAMYKTHADRGGMFKRFDVLYGVENDELIKRDQF